MFVSHCIEAASAADAPQAVATVVRRAVADETFLASLAARKADGLADDGTLYRSSALTVLPAVHVYGGDLIGTVRSVWDRDTGAESSLDWDALRGRAKVDPS